MRIKDIFVICLIVTTAISWTLYWLSTLSISYWEVDHIEMVSVTRQFPEKPLGVFHTYRDYEGLEGQPWRELNDTEWRTIAVKLNLTDIVEQSKYLYSNSVFLEIIVEPWFETFQATILNIEQVTIPSNITSKAVYHVIVEQRELENHDCVLGPAFVIPENKTLLPIYVHTRRIVQNSKFENNTCFLRIYFRISVRYWSEKPYKIIVEEPRLVWIRVTKHIFGDDIAIRSRNTLEYENGFTQFGLLLISLFLSIFTLASIILVREKAIKEEEKVK